MIARLVLAAALLSALPAFAQRGPLPGGSPPGERPRGDRPGDGSQGPEGSEGPGGRRPSLQIFISPAGEPFRSPLGSPYPVADWFARADADHDGAITRDELVVDSLAFFARLDADHDGTIDGFEADDYEKTIAPEILSRGALDVGGGPPGANRPRGGRRPDGGGSMGGKGPGGKGKPYGLERSGAGLYGLINEVQPVMAQDSDFNRRISKAEAIAAAKDRFRILDKDGDGKLTLDTLPKTPLQKLLEERAMDAP